MGGAQSLLGDEDDSGARGGARDMERAGRLGTGGCAGVASVIAGEGFDGTTGGSRSGGPSLEGGVAEGIF